MSIKTNLKITAGCLSYLAVMAFAQHDDDKVKSEEESLSGPAVLIVSCAEATANDPDRECAP